jgi:hypothetical protein
MPMKGARRNLSPSARAMSFCNILISCRTASSRDGLSSAWRHWSNFHTDALERLIGSASKDARLRALRLAKEAAHRAELSANSEARLLAKRFGTALTVMTLADRYPAIDRGGCHAQTITPTAKDHGTCHA